MKPGILFIVATPIGNLSDMTFRAIETLKSVDFVVCEDTRVTQKLLKHYSIETKTMSYHQHSTGQKVQEIVELLEQGKNLALVSDAGTPGISDPGNLLIGEIYERKKFEVQVIPIPGASAIISALSVSGFPTDKFLFLGFPPHKKKRQKFFQTVADSSYTVGFYESSHRIAKALESLGAFLEPDREMCVCREISKAFESVYRGNIQKILDQKIPEKGEFVIIIKGKEKHSFERESSQE